MPTKFVKGPDGVSTVPSRVQVVIPVSASSVDQWAFVADAPYEVVEVEEIHTVAGSDASAVTLDVVKASGTTAPASGTSVLSSTFSLKSTANTLVSKTAASGLTTTRADRILADGDRLGINFTGTLTAVAGGALVIRLKRLQSVSGDK